MIASVTACSSALYARAAYLRCEGLRFQRVVQEPAVPVVELPHVCGVPRKVYKDLWQSSTKRRLPWAMAAALGRALGLNLGSFWGGFDDHFGTSWGSESEKGRPRNLHEKG